MKTSWTAAASALIACAMAGAASSAPPTDAPVEAGGLRSLGTQVAPAPAWVTPAKEADGTGLEASPMHYRVVDQQIHLDATGVATYSHMVRVVDTPAGLDRAAQIALVFDPGYQRFAWHHLEVVRKGRRLNRLDPALVEVLQREAKLERRAIDGRLTIAVTLDDIQVGDEIDYAYSVLGTNPVFDDRFVEAGYFGSFHAPVATQQVRLLAPARRSIALQELAGAEKTTRTLGDMRETVLRATALPQIRLEAGAPASTILKSGYHFTEFADWQAVAAWGTQLFAEPAASPLIDAKAAQIRAAAPDQQARVLAALDLVQRDVRYFGLEMGVNSHRPYAPELVLQRRLGDCKDKVALLLALLRRLDVDAVPVLVSTRFGNSIADLPPTPLAFDHVIVRVALEGTTYWLDTTRGRQTGPLAARSVHGFGRGLALEKGSNALIGLPAAFGQLRMAVADRFVFGKIPGDARLDSRITYRSDLAEMIRNAVDSKGLADLATDLSAPYRRVYPSLKVVAPAELQEVEGDDAVVIVQHFGIGDIWRLVEGRSFAADVLHWSLLDALNAPRSDSRRAPLAYARPGIYKHDISLDFAQAVRSQASPSQHAEDGDSHFRWTSEITQQRQHFQVNEELRIQVEQVTPQEWSAYMATLARVRPKLADSIVIPGDGGKLHWRLSSRDGQVAQP